MGLRSSFTKVKTTSLTKSELVDVLASAKTSKDTCGSVGLIGPFSDRQVRGNRFKDKLRLHFPQQQTVHASL